MRRSRLTIPFLVFQTLWMLVILPGHVRGMITLGNCPACEAGGAAPKTPSCCAAKKTGKGTAPNEEQKSRCAVCDQARGYSEVPVFEFEFKPTGLLELCRLIEPSKLHRLLCDPVYFANGPPRHIA